MAKEIYHSYASIRERKRRRSNQQNLQKIQSNGDCRIAVVLHMFYEKSWKEIRQYLLNLEAYEYDLYVTVTQGRLSQKVLDEISSFRRNVTVLVCENKGFDLLPFLKALRQIDLDQYDVLFKLQSKSTKRPWIYIYDQLFLRRDWFVNLYEGVLGAETVHTTIDKLYRDQNVGLVAAENLYVQDPLHKQQLSGKIAARHGLELQDGYRFVAGTCFATKAQCLREFQQMELPEDAFAPVPATRGISFGHFLERYLCASIVQQGYSFYGNSVCSGRRAFLKPITNWMYRHSSERLHEENLHFDPEWFFWQMDNQLISWKYVTAPLSKLMYVRGVERIPFTENAPYQYLKGNVQGYLRYCEEHERLGLPQMTPERFDWLVESIRANGYDSRSMIVVDTQYNILDGQHRACCLCHLYGEDACFQMLRIRNLRIRSILFSLAPQSVRRFYYAHKSR